KTRNAEVTRMFDYAFSQYMSHPIFETGDTIGKIPVEKGEMQELEITAKHPYSILLKKGTPVEEIRHELRLEQDIKAPIAIGQKLGTLVVYKGDEIVSEFPVESPAEVKRAGWWKLLKRT